MVGWWDRRNPADSNVCLVLLHERMGVVAGVKIMGWKARMRDRIEWQEVRMQNNLEAAKNRGLRHMDIFLRKINSPYDPLEKYPNRKYSYESQCQGKMKYDSWRDANKRYKKLVSKTHRQFKIYKCGYCNTWHIGRTDKTTEEKNGIKYNIW